VEGIALTVNVSIPDPNICGLVVCLTLPVKGELIIAVLKRKLILIACASTCAGACVVGVCLAALALAVNEAMLVGSRCDAENFLKLIGEHIDHCVTGCESERAAHYKCKQEGN
jgi:hypothetical protein